MTIHPLYDKVLLSENKSSTTTKSGILVESGSNDSKHFTVLATGPNCKFIAVGDKVYFDISKATVVLSEGKQLVLVSEEFLTAMVTD